MLPHEARKRLLKQGTLLGLCGDYNAHSIWGERKILSMSLSEYLIVERHDKILRDSLPSNLDIGIIAVREKPISLSDIGTDGKIFSGHKFLLLNRYSEVDWDDKDPTVHVFGLADDIPLTSPLLKESWHPQAVWLSAAAMMCVIEPDKMSEIGTFLMARYEVI